MGYPALRMECDLTILSSVRGAKEGGVLPWHHSVCQSVGTSVRLSSRTGCLEASVRTVPL